MYNNTAYNTIMYSDEIDKFEEWLEELDKDSNRLLELHKLWMLENRIISGTLIQANTVVGTGVVADVEVELTEHFTDWLFGKYVQMKQMGDL